MFKKVLVAEDFDSINIVLVQTLKALGVKEIDHAKYCDDALLKIKKANLDNSPFDLIISDLSFTDDYRKVILKTGEELLRAIKIEQPTIKSIVYSVEYKDFRIKSLFDDIKIDAFVHKGRKSIVDLKRAINIIFNKNDIFISPEMNYILQNKISNEIDTFDIELIRQLSQGIAQEKMDEKFKELGIKPNSKSTIEKRIGKLKDYFKASNTVHLIAIAKDLGIA